MVFTLEKKGFAGSGNIFTLIKEQRIHGAKAPCVLFTKVFIFLFSMSFIATT